MATSFSQSDLALLKAHLAAIIEVEFFTIPYYLDAVYSFTSTALNYTVPGNDGAVAKPLYDLQQEALSVAVQEMYHLQLACNLANAFDEFKPKDIPPLTLEAGVSIQIPHLEPDHQPLNAMLGDLPAAIATMIAIETADPNPFPPISPDVVYPSISDLYNATLQLLAKYWGATTANNDPHLDPNSPQVAYGTFSWTYKYNKVTDRQGVMDAINAITDQGEGKVLPTPPNANANAGTNAAMAALAQFVSLFRRAADDECVDPAFQPAAGTRFYAYGMKTHYKRFVDVMNQINVWTERVSFPLFYVPGAPQELPAWVLQTYGTIDNAYTTIQNSLNTVWSALIDAMRAGFADGSLNDSDGTEDKPSFNDMMLTFKYSIPLVWQLGRVPSFVYLDPADRMPVGQALDAVDHFCVVHWDPRTEQLRQQPGFVKNACQGLNTCEGRGWGGLGTKPGDGACSTADFHTCGGGNDCTTQGGCGFLSTDKDQNLYPYSDQWAPSMNDCSHRGGCQTPISTGQVFAYSTWTKNAIQQSSFTDDQKKALTDLCQTNVWDHARALLAKKLGVDVSELPAPRTGSVGSFDYDGTTRRNAVYPSST